MENNDILPANISWPSLPQKGTREFELSLKNFREEMLTVLGQYQVGKPPVIFSPLQTKYQWPRATKKHEEIHQTLILNTTYGFFYQILTQYNTPQKLDSCLRCKMSIS